MWLITWYLTHELKKERQRNKRKPSALLWVSKSQDPFICFILDSVMQISPKRIMWNAKTFYSIFAYLTPMSHFYRNRQGYVVWAFCLVTWIHWTQNGLHRVLSVAQEKWNAIGSQLFHKEYIFLNNCTFVSVLNGPYIRFVQSIIMNCCLLLLKIGVLDKCPWKQVFKSLKRSL